MTNKLPEALRVAAALDAGENFYGESSLWYDNKLAESVGEAAALLRTQHALLEKARAALSHSNPSEPIWKTPHRDTLAALNQHLDQP